MVSMKLRTGGSKKTSSQKFKMEKEKVLLMSRWQTVFTRRTKKLIQINLKQSVKIN